MCVTCGCCAQAVEPAELIVASSVLPSVAQTEPPLPQFPQTDPRPILHVPKSSVA
jgi:hypothetical protein